MYYTIHRHTNCPLPKFCPIHRKLSTNEAEFLGAPLHPQAMPYDLYWLQHSLSDIYIWRKVTLREQALLIYVFRCLVKFCECKLADLYFVLYLWSRLLSWPCFCVCGLGLYNAGLVNIPASCGLYLVPINEARRNENFTEFFNSVKLHAMCFVQHRPC